MEETAQNFEKRFFINRSQIFIALPKFYVTHQNYEILSKSLVPTVQSVGNVGSVQTCLLTVYVYNTDPSQICCYQIFVLKKHRYLYPGFNIVQDQNSYQYLQLFLFLKDFLSFRSPCTYFSADSDPSFLRLRLGFEVITDLYNDRSCCYSCLCLDKCSKRVGFGQIQNVFQGLLYGIFSYQDVGEAQEVQRRKENVEGAQ